MKKQLLIAVLALPLVFAGCSRSDENGSGMSIDLSDSSGEDSEKITIGGDGEDGQFSIKADGFSMDIDLPEITLDSNDFDMNNVSLYPGTKITKFNVEDQKGEGGKVTVSFVSPASVTKVAEWFESEMSGEKLDVSKDGNNLSGTTDEGDPFSLKLTEKSADEASGILEFSEK